jgi:hypothetical protein
VDKAALRWLASKPYRIVRNDTGTLIYASASKKEARDHLKELRKKYRGRIEFTKHGF